VEIYLKYNGKFDVPMPELTPEEIAEQEKQRQLRAYYREKQRRYAAKKKQGEQEIQTA
jgi:hypothetical protein